MEEVITPEALPDVPQLSTADGDKGADQTVSIPLSTLQEILGKEFKDVDGALKSIKDTYSYVGSQGEYREKISQLATALDTDEQGVLSTIENLMNEINNGEGEGQVPVAPVVDGAQYVTKDDMFFMNNKDLAELRDVLTPIKNASEESRVMPWDQFVATETAQKILVPINGYREVQSQRSVLDSSPRLGSATDKLGQAAQFAEQSAQAEREGNMGKAQQLQQGAKDNAVEAVLEAFDLRS